MYSKEEVDEIVKDAITKAMQSSKELHIEIVQSVFDEIIDATQEHALEKPEFASAALGSAMMLRVTRDKIVGVLGDLQGKVCTSEDEFKFYQSMMGGQRGDS